MTDKMLSRKDGRVGTLIFNNPQRHNAVSLDMWDATGAHPGRFSPRTTRSRVVVVTGAGGKAFVSGADISRFGDERSNRGGRQALQHGGRKGLRRASISFRSRPSR